MRALRPAGRPLGRRRRGGIAAAAAKLLGTSVESALPLQRHPPWVVLTASVAELGALAVLIGTGSIAAGVLLLACSVLLVVVVVTNTRRVLVITAKGNVILTASTSGWPDGVVGPADPAIRLPEPAGLGVAVTIGGGRWWIDRSSYRSLRRARSLARVARPTRPGRGAAYCSLIARMIVVKEKVTAAATVIRSRLRSTTVDPAAADPSPPPNISDRPPPRPLWSRMSTIKVSDTMTWIARMRMVTDPTAFFAPGTRPGRHAN